MIITVLNGDQWIDNCLESIVKQTFVQSLKQKIPISSDEQRQYEAQNPFLTTMTHTLNTTQTLTATSQLNEVFIKPEARPVQIEVCVFDDCSCDNTLKILNKWQTRLKELNNIEMKIIENSTGKSKGGQLLFK